ncbi:MAG TPA: hypothetical protein VIH99_07575 [Bdellovibrionota bacterium]
MSTALALCADSPGDGLSLDRLGDCNWQVTYRGRTYDLAPLTRESLSRPIESDIRFVLDRVPESHARLEEMNSRLSSARTQTIIASIFVSALLVTKLLESRLTNEVQIRDYKKFEWGFGGLFLGTTFLSWRNSSKAKEELVNAVKEFNEHSPYKIEPASASADGLK